jgi:hypothetical protein
LSVASSIISTPASSSSCPTASTSRTCNHRPTLSLALAREEPDSSRKPPPRKMSARSRWDAPTSDWRELP